jgi:NhaP-type Na+/H+ or K+/H+ antiporter
MLCVLLESESLFNDATSILLFEVFLKGSLQGASQPDPDLFRLLPSLVSHIGYLSLSGAALGLAMGLATR